eukprot:15595295-Heterocapsa_arctica.AAC.1
MSNNNWSGLLNVKTVLAMSSNVTSESNNDDDDDDNDNIVKLYGVRSVLFGHRRTPSPKSEAATTPDLM